MKTNIFYSCGENGGFDDETCGCGLPIEDCGCGSDSDQGCGCGGGCGCGSDDSANGCGSGCGCGGHQQMVRINFEDGTEYDCPVLAIFDVNEQEYIALYHPEKQRALLYRFEEDENGIFLDGIDSEEEFNLVSAAFQNL